MDPFSKLQQILQFFWVTLIAIALGLAAIPGSKVATDRTELGVAFVCGSLFSTFLLWKLARRNPNPFLFMIRGMALAAALGLGTYLANVSAPGEAPKGAFVACLLAGVACGILIYKKQHAISSDFPNVLAGNLPKQDVFETGGVQFGGVLTPGKDRQPHQFSVYLQNCFDVSADVEVHIDPDRDKKYIRHHPEHFLTLGAAEVSRITFPLVTPTYPGEYAFYLEVHASHDGGKRVRPWPAQEATRRTRTSTTVAMAALGHIEVGGGIRFTVGPLPDDLWAAPLTPPLQVSLWRPYLGTVPQAPVW